MLGPNIVVRHEHMVVAAKRARSHVWHESRDEEFALARQWRAVVKCEVVLVSGGVTIANVLSNKFDAP